MTRAELQYIRSPRTPRAVIVLCPGHNGSAEGFFSDSKWLNFARKNALGLVGLSFASPLESLHDEAGYYYASKGSGEKLLEGIRKIYGRNLPLLLYGISGGAHFTSRFQQWKPDQVIAWCAYSAGWWDQPKPSAVESPGIVACGDEDSRYGASMMYFKQGRAAGGRWLWISLARTGHAQSPALEGFVRDYFESILNSTLRDGVWVDVDHKETLESPSDIPPALSAWLPSQSLLDSWCRVHSP